MKWCFPLALLSYALILMQGMLIVSDHVMIALFPGIAGAIILGYLASSADLYFLLMKKLRKDE